MSRVLQIIGSPRSAGVSNQLGRAFMAAYREAHPADEIDVLDLWSEELPFFGGAAADGKLKGMSGVPLPPEEQAAFDKVLGHITRLKAADKVVLSSGMWNFSVPYRVKHYIDVVVQAGHTFGFDPSRGYFGLITGRPVQLLLATGGDYSQAPMQAADMLTPYLTSVFRFMGFEDIRAVTVGSTAYPPEVSGPAVARSLDQARSAGTAF